DLTALAARIPGFVRGPLVGGALLVRRAPALAGVFPLFLRRHRGKSAAFLAFSVVHRPVLCNITAVRSCPVGRALPTGYRIKPCATPAARGCWQSGRKSLNTERITKGASAPRLTHGANLYTPMRLLIHEVRRGFICKSGNLEKTTC